MKKCAVWTGIAKNLYLLSSFLLKPTNKRMVFTKSVKELLFHFLLGFTVSTQCPTA
jgi:hypothetical protein